MDYSIKGELISNKCEEPMISVEYQMGDHRNKVDLGEWLAIRVLSAEKGKHVGVIIEVSLMSHHLAGRIVEIDNQPMYPVISTPLGNYDIRTWLGAKIKNYALGDGILLGITIS